MAGKVTISPNSVRRTTSAQFLIILVFCRDNLGNRYYISNCYDTKEVQEDQWGWCDVWRREGDSCGFQICKKDSFTMVARLFPGNGLDLEMHVNNSHKILMENLANKIAEEFNINVSIHLV